MRDLYCWSRWYAMRNNPHQEGSLPQFTNCREEVFSETQRHRMSRGCTQTETQRSVVGLLVHACRLQPRLLLHKRPSPTICWALHRQQEVVGLFRDACA
jgi:hypothetical protein